MAFKALVLADSVSPCGARLTTFEATYPRCIHSEIMTHRQMSRNAASSRAIPVATLIAQIEDDPFIPDFRLNQKGMQAGGELDEAAAAVAREKWLAARDAALATARELQGLEIHKQYVNRILEPWMWITVIMSATEWANFFTLRVHPAAEPSFRRIAAMMYRLYKTSEPKALDHGEWHLPLVRDEDWDDQRFMEMGPSKISAGRCARVSYLTHDGRRDLSADLSLYEKLLENVHMSPMEHPAMCVPAGAYADTGNFHPAFLQLRKTIPGECYEHLPELPLEEL